MSEAVTIQHPTLAKIAGDLQGYPSLDQLEGIGDSIVSLFPVYNIVSPELSTCLDDGSAEANCMVVSEATNAIALAIGYTPYRLAEVQGVYPHNSSVIRSTEGDWFNIDISPNKYGIHQSKVKPLDGSVSFSSRLLNEIATINPVIIYGGIQEAKPVITDNPEEAVSLLGDCELPSGLLLPEILAVSAARHAATSRVHNNHSGGALAKFRVEQAAHFAASYYRTPTIEAAA